MQSLLYEAIRELHYIQNVPNCSSGLCATSKGREIVEKGVNVLRVRDLARESLYSATEDE